MNIVSTVVSLRNRWILLHFQNRKKNDSRQESRNQIEYTFQHNYYMAYRHLLKQNKNKNLNMISRRHQSKLIQCSYATRPCVIYSEWHPIQMILLIPFFLSYTAQRTTRQTNLWQEHNKVFSVWNEERETHHYFSR